MLSVLANGVGLRGIGGLTPRKTYANMTYTNVCHNEICERVMAKKITTVYLEEHQKESLERVAEERGERVATVLREAVEWYMAITPYLRKTIGELSSIYEELTADAIISRLIAEDERRRNKRNTKESGIKSIKMDTEQIIEILMKADAMEILQSISAARAVGCDCVEGFDKDGYEIATK